MGFSKSLLLLLTRRLHHLRAMIPRLHLQVVMMDQMNSLHLMGKPKVFLIISQGMIQEMRILMMRVMKMLRIRKMMMRVMKMLRIQKMMFRMSPMMLRETIIWFHLVV